MSYKYAISTKKDGNMSFLWGEAGEVSENRKKFLTRAGFAINKCVAAQVSNSEVVHIVNKTDFAKGMFDTDNSIQADALITTEPDLGLFIVVADCSPTIFYDEKNGVLCLAHLNGMNPGLISVVMSTLTSVFKTKSSDIRVFMGPSIKKESFIVPDPFQRHSDTWQGFIQNIDEHQTAIDMIGFLKDEMFNQGILVENIEISDVDTYKDPRYFSHRRSVVKGETEGRFAFAVRLI